MIKIQKTIFLNAAMMQCNRQMLYRNMVLLFLGAITFLLFVEPSFAQTLESIDKAANNIDAWLGGSIAKTVAGIAVAAVGYACLANRLSWFWFFAVILGIAIIFGRQQIVNMFAG
ncbi:TrbC/VirB2 family protein [Bartonella choladocola]|uniref:Type IV secretory pathway, VirB2 component (Pilin) n=1 Tax=Bartonella choladocola TaxID=2750995 RepID=A0A1U9MK36_9HYPH|nr:TrbC/VirB2 family protein [Bartonella choladocola]AQT48011.1 Type IV secretory pathway, VirB2 component (pilin) [Bartonella choladocola]